jgi:hypothetical protein
VRESREALKYVMPTKVPALSQEAHRLNEIEARKAWVQTVRIYCSSMRNRLERLVYGPR